MGCCDEHGKLNCVCNAVRHIHEMQEAVESEDKCPTSCFEDLLSPTLPAGPTRDTVPFVLYCKGDCNDLFRAFGGVGSNSCFSTIFFRVRKVKGCCATLELLRPVNSSHQKVDVTTPCSPFNHLERTDFCIEVDLHCFCAIQCFSPELVKR